MLRRFSLVLISSVLMIAVSLIDGLPSSVVHSYILVTEDEIRWRIQRLNLVYDQLKLFMNGLTGQRDQTSVANKSLGAGPEARRRYTG